MSIAIIIAVKIPMIITVEVVLVIAGSTLGAREPSPSSDPPSKSPQWPYFSWHEPFDSSSRKWNSPTP